MDTVSKLDLIIASLARIEERQKQHEIVLFGDGRAGLVLDVDRLKQSHRRTVSYMKALWALVVALSGTLVTFIWKVK